MREGLVKKTIQMITGRSVGLRFKKINNDGSILSSMVNEDILGSTLNLTDFLLRIICFPAYL